MKVYISGPIKGKEETYRDTFAEAVREVKDLYHLSNYEVISPVAEGDALEKFLGRKPIYEEYMQGDIVALLKCDVIYMLRGWEHSAGARCEHLVAVMCGLGIGYQ